MKKISWLHKIKHWIKNHKKISFLILVIVIILAYYLYKYYANKNAPNSYVITGIRYGNIVHKVTGSGQVSASNQIDVKSQVSGTVKSINVKVGDRVKKGQLLATIDNTSALLDLESARIAYAKLVKPARQGDITNAKNNLNKSYTDAFNAISSAYIDLPNIISGLKDMYYTPTGYLSDQNSTQLSPTGRTYRDTAATSYDKAVDDYERSLNLYKSVNRNSATTTLITVIEQTQNTVKNISEALKNTQNAITFIKTAQSEYYPAGVASAISNVTTWSNTTNSDLSNIISSRNSIESYGNTLQTLITGADDLDIASARLTLTQKEQNYAEYFIRAPFDGIVGKIPVNVYDEASGGTVIATVVGDNKTSTISLNEVDAAKVVAGQKVTLTFDAIDNLNATGTVREADLVGTVTQGVVTYNVKIDINTEDSRVKPGMSVNATIITGSKEHVLIAPSSAIKTQGNTKYVEVFEGLATSTISGQQTNRPAFASSTNFANRNSTTTRAYIAGNETAQTRTTTITSNVQPRKQNVEIGDSDDTNTEIISGLKVGDKIVMKTISGTASKSTTTTPNILSGLGGNRGTGTAGATRIGR